MKSKLRSCLKKEQRNNLRKMSMKSIKNKRRMDKSRRSNEDIQRSPKSKSKTKSKTKQKNKNKKRRHRKYSDDESSDMPSHADSDIDEYVALQNGNFHRDELNAANVDLFAGYFSNESVHKLKCYERKSIADSIVKQKRKNIKNPIVQSEIVQENETLIEENENVKNDFFGGHHFVVSGSEDGNVCIWNRMTQKMIKLQGHSKSVGCVAWNPVDSFILASGSDDHQIRVWQPAKQ